MYICASSARILSLLATVIFGTVASGFGTVTSADPGAPGVTVKYSDLNLERPDDARLLYERIRAAAYGGCSYFWFKTDADEAHCRRETIASAVSKVNRPTLTAVYNEKYPSTASISLALQTH
jgi:UrcA family protein